MKKVSLLTLAFFAGMSANVMAGEITKGQEATCQNANSIEIEVKKIATVEDPKNFGYTTNDHGTANLVVWKSANFTTVPITLGPNESNHTFNADDHGKVGLPILGEMGRNVVRLEKQTEFSRGDSIGDISGTVKITNTGMVPVTVTCK
jgi:hypothetical protein